MCLTSGLFLSIALLYTCNIRCVDSVNSTKIKPQVRTIEPMSAADEIPDDTNDFHLDVGLTTTEMVRRRRYLAEEHLNVETPDGYLLTLHRIPHGKNNTNVKNRPVAFLMHGIITSSSDWVILGPGRGLAYVLADAGYDVWMGNARGNKYSRHHAQYNPDKDREFWDFSWHEIGAIDQPTMIDYILDVTGQKQLYYIGHSQGTTTFFVMASERPEYNKKIRLMVALSPVAFMGNMENAVLKVLALFNGAIKFMLTSLGIHELLPSNPVTRKIGYFVCKNGSALQPLCSTVFYTFVGWNIEKLNKSIIPIILSNAPAGVSVRQLVHFAQLINTGNFQKFDYGFLKNERLYDSADPPEYDLEQITARVALIYAKYDLFSSKKDLHRLRRRLPNVVNNYRIDDFEHVDFIFSVDAKKRVYDHILRLFKKYT